MEELQVHIYSAYLTTIRGSRQPNRSLVALLFVFAVLSENMRKYLISRTFVN